MPYVILTNDPTPSSEVMLGCIIDDYASISAAVVMLPGIRMGSHSLVAAQACVTKDVPPNMLAAVIPARIICKAYTIKLSDGSGLPAYPWIHHFKRGFPEAITKEWSKTIEEES
jgi:tetrahydrodipicolinate N-succinyltransferase